MCVRCVRSSVGTRVLGIGRGTYVPQYVRISSSWQFFSSIYVRAFTLGSCSTYISRRSMYTLNPGAVCTYLFCSINFFFDIIYVYVRRLHQQCSSYVDQYVVRTGQEQVIVHACTVGTVVGTVIGTVGTYIRQQVHQQVQYVHKYSSNRYSSMFSRYGRDFVVDLGMTLTMGK